MPPPSRSTVTIVLGKPYDTPKVIERASLSSSEFDACLGRYRYGPDTIVTVLRQGGGIAYRWKDLPYLQPLTPLSESTYFARGIYATVEFSRNDDGDVKQMTLGKTVCLRME